MGKVVRLLIPDFCKTEHKLYHALDRACAICVPDSYARWVLWNKEYSRWYPLAWFDDGYWDEKRQRLVNKDGDILTIPAMSAPDFNGFGPGTKIVVEDLPDDVYEHMMEAMKISGEFDKVWFAYEDTKNKLMDS